MNPDIELAQDYPQYFHVDPVSAWGNGKRRPAGLIADDYLIRRTKVRASSSLPSATMARIFELNQKIYAAERVARPRRQRGSMLISFKRTKKFIMQYTADKRAHKFNRVSEYFIESLDSRLRAWIRDHVSQMPGRGKTIK